MSRKSFANFLYRQMQRSLLNWQHWFAACEHCWSSRFRRKSLKRRASLAVDQLNSLFFVLRLELGGDHDLRCLAQQGALAMLWPALIFVLWGKRCSPVGFTLGEK